MAHTHYTSHRWLTYTDVAFRQLCKEQRADVMATEFVMSDSLIRGGRNCWRAVDFTDNQRPMGVQIFGSNPKHMAQATILIEERIKPDFIDINCGFTSNTV